MATTIEDIKRVLWAGADTFRGVIDAANYKDYVLTMLFIKFLNDTFEEWVDELKAKYPDKPDRVARAIPRLPFQLKEDIRYTYLYDKRYDSDIGATITSNCFKFPSTSRCKGLARVSPHLIWASGTLWIKRFMRAIA